MVESQNSYLEKLLVEINQKIEILKAKYAQETGNDPSLIEEVLRKDLKESESYPYLKRITYLTEFIDCITINE